MFSPPKVKSPSRDETGDVTTSIEPASAAASPRKPEATTPHNPMTHSLVPHLLPSPSSDSPKRNNYKKLSLIGGKSLDIPAMNPTSSKLRR